MHDDILCVIKSMATEKEVRRQEGRQPQRAQIKKKAGSRAECQHKTELLEAVVQEKCRQRIGEGFTQ